MLEQKKETYMASRTHVSVDAVSPSQRLPAWHDLISTHVGRTPESFRLRDASHWEPLVGQTFSGSLEYGMLGGAGFCRLVATPHRFSRAMGARQEDIPSPLMLLMQQKGCALLEQDGRSAMLEPGDWCILDAAQPFVVDHPYGCDQIILTPPRPSDPALVDLIARTRASRCDGRTGSSRLVQTMVREAYGQFDRLPASTAKTLADAITALAWHAVQERFAAPGKDTVRDTQRNKFKAFIDKHLAEPGLCVEMVAQGCGCSVRTVHRAFANDALGSASEYIWQQRVAQCASDLKNPRHASRSLTDIAMQWGFSSSSHFSRVFRSSLGVSPKAYRAGS
ncbi:AraC-type DNA-binding protein [Rhodoferax sp. OV413]|nr:AraC-type DNA-binding protein [Rhodoferax sp. OV413]